MRGRTFALNKQFSAPSDELIFSSVKALFLALALALPTHAASNLPREAGAVYLEDFAVKPARLAIVADAAVYTKPGDGKFLGTIRKGSSVELLAIADTAYRVRGQARQGDVAGWVDVQAVSALKPEFVESLKQNAKRKAEVDAMIAKGEVALNMTPQEVTAALGKIQKKTSKLDAQGRKEVWEVVRYTRVPQETTGYDRAGRLVTSTVYIKVPSGKLTVTFDNNLVSALEQTEGNTDVQPPVRLVPVPIFVVN